MDDMVNNLQHHLEGDHMNTARNIGNRIIGTGQPVYIIAEIGINHNGDLDVAKAMIKQAHDAGADCVKFQKRTPLLCVPEDQRSIERDTPWGRMTYLDYRYRVEFDEHGYRDIETFCAELGIDWTVSCWDEGAVEFMEQHFNVPFYKAASASLTDHALLKLMQSTGKPLMISTGMSTMEEIDEAVAELNIDTLLIAHATSAYPCATSELNLRMIPSDQAASVETGGLQRLVRDIRDVQAALGDGVKRVYESEHGVRAKLRRVMSPAG